MYRVLIVDDEFYEREGIRRQLSSGQYGISQLDVAENGLVALKRFEANPYDIVISDVKMPVMDGLTMALKMQDISPDVKILFFSGYEDFNFVKQAIQIHAYDYLLKPAGDKLVSKVKELTGLLDEEYELKRRQQSISEANFQQQTLLGMELLDSFFNGQWNSIRRILENLRYLESSYLVWGYGYRERPSEEEEELLRLQQELRRYLSGISDNSLIGILEGAILLIFPVQIPLTQRRMHEISNGIKQAVQLCGDEEWQFEFSSYPVTEALFDRVCQWKDQVVTPCGRDAGKFHHNSRIVNKMISIVQSRYMEDLTIKQIAEEVLYSPNYLSMIFKRECGQGFYDYLVSVRMRKAKQMLVEENVKIYQVANAVGYEDTVAFIKRFRREFGCTPAQFRNGSPAKEQNL